ncbi:hypothetical protein DWV67_15320, partial [Dorea formicigenerans]
LYACVVSMLFDALMSAMLYRNIGQEPPVAFIIDEFGQLPAMPVLSKSAALLRAIIVLSCFPARASV